jgi:two-component system heavy metal sensor histidine kinase CusS
MSLLNRVSTFFLVALAVVLASYSVLFYGLVRRQLQQQFDQQLHGALHTLVAAVEVESDDVKWEPSDHTVALGTEDGLEDVRWAIYDEQGLLVERSRNLAPLTTSDDALLEFAEAERSSDAASVDVGVWRILQKRLAAPAPKPADERDPRERAALVVTVGRSPRDLNANLARIGWLACLLPLGAWLVAAVAGRWLFARALEPVRAMATQARTMGASQPGRWLPIAAAQDELAELGTAFNSLLDQLYQALERQRRFTGDAAHQLRTPLTALLGQVEVALRRPRSLEEHCRTLTILREQAVELGQIVEGLLFLARVEQDVAVPGSEHIELGRWLEKYLERWSNDPRREDLQLRVDCRPLACVPPALLGQLIDNLVNNAIKYSEAGTPVIVALKRSADHPDSIQIEVSDRGAGIGPDDLQAIFEPFYRSRQARQSGVAGTGLGLAIAARIADVMRGRLTCTSEPGKGSRFVFEFPAGETSGAGIEVGKRFTTSSASKRN